MAQPPFDPNLPADNSLIVAAELRNQLNALFVLIDNGLAFAASRPINVDSLNLTVSNPPTQAQVQTIASKVDELITALQG